MAHPDTGQPYVSRVATVAQQANMLMLISTLSIHTKALKTNPNCALLVGEPGDKGDPLTHPRLTLSGRATLTDKAAQRDAWLAAIPRAKLYFDFADFQMYRLTPTAIDFNGGFGQAFRLTPADVS
ncbi:MAG: pyridoxamine 5'-phosphate oxidase family protein [Pseudomonadota bacterium]